MDRVGRNSPTDRELKRFTSFRSQSELDIGPGDDKPEIRTLIDTLTVFFYVSGRSISIDYDRIIL